MQATLFQTDARVVADDELGTIAYFPGCVAAEEAARWFAELRDAVAWKGERRMMYERAVDVPRLVARFAMDAEELPAALRAAAKVAQRLASCDFNSVGLNFYRDGQDSVALHNDTLHELVEGAPIAVLSLGTTRRMSIRTKKAPRKTIYLDLEPGSLLVMSYATQHHFDHGVPKVRVPVGPRISVAFRRRPPSRW